MARRQIPPEVKEKVKRRIVEGKSLTQAVEGTDVHFTTAFYWQKNEFKDIQSLRSLYIDKIREAGADEYSRATEWANMATQKRDLNAKYKALTYIDELVGIKQKDASPMNVVVLPIMGGGSVQRYDGDQENISAQPTN